MGGLGGGTIHLATQTSACLIGGIPTIELISGNLAIPMTESLASPIPAASVKPTATLSPPTSAALATSPTAGTDIVLERKFVVRLDQKPGMPEPPPAGGAGQGVVRLGWDQTDSDAATCASGTRQISAIDMVLPGDTTPITVELADQPGLTLTVCPPRLRVSEIELDPTSKPVDPPRYWSFAITEHATAHAGQTVDFTVTLQNIYYRALQFSDGCPSYVEALSGPQDWSTGKEWYVLNCVPIGRMEPGATVLLAMNIAIPPSAIAGTYSLIWEMDVGEASYGAATTTFNVVAGSP